VAGAAAWGLQMQMDKLAGQVVPKNYICTHAHLGNTVCVCT